MHRSGVELCRLRWGRFYLERHSRSHPGKVLLNQWRREEISLESTAKQQPGILNRGLELRLVPRDVKALMVIRRYRVGSNVRGEMDLLCGELQSLFHAYVVFSVTRK